MLTPVTIGMPRSASRATWQITRFLSHQKEKPEYYLVPESLMSNHPWRQEAWPPRSHFYLSSMPAVYTYRHPVEAFLSLKSRLLIDIGKAGTPSSYNESSATEDAAKAIGLHLEIYKKLLRDQIQGRPLLFLRYEDYYNDHAKRIVNIGEFMKSTVTQDLLNNISDNTNIHKNFERGNNLAKILPSSPFSGIQFVEYGIQRNHVSSETMGVPGGWLEKYPETVRDIFSNINNANYMTIATLCDTLGYKKSIN